VYVDLDFKAFKPIGPILEDRHVGLVWEPIEHTDKVADIGISRRLFNGFMMSEPGNEFWSQWMDFIVANYDETNRVYDTTGPVAFAVYAQMYGYTVDNYPDYYLNTCLFLPIVVTNAIASGCSKDVVNEAYAVTYWHEGSGWGRETLSGVVEPDPPKSNSLVIIMIIVFSIILLGSLSALCVLLIKK
jgi:hypothetical protein